MKIYQVEIRTQDKAELDLSAMLGSRRAVVNTDIKTFGSKEKAEEFANKCREAYKFLHEVTGGVRLQSMTFHVKEFEVEA